MDLLNSLARIARYAHLGCGTEAVVGEAWCIDWAMGFAELEVSNWGDVGSGSCVPCLRLCVRLVALL